MILEGFSRISYLFRWTQTPFVVDARSVAGRAL